MLWVDPEGIEAVGAAADRARADVGRVRVSATGSLGSIGRWAERDSVDGCLSRAGTLLERIAADHRVRRMLAHGLLGHAWTSHTPANRGMGSTAGSGPSQITTQHDETIAELEGRIAGLERMPGFTGRGQALAALYAQLRQAREDQLSALVGRYHADVPSGVAAAYRADLRAAIVDSADALGLDAAGFRAAASAMLNGTSPEAAGLDRLYFPADYVAAHGRYTELVDLRGALALELGEAQEAAIEATWWDRDAQQSAWEEVWRLEDELAATNDQIDEAFGDGLGMPLSAVAAYLDGLVLVDESDRVRILGRFFAERVSTITSRSGDLDPVGAVISDRLVSPAEAAAFYEALPAELVPLLPTLMFGAHPNDTAASMRPFAQVLARATHHDGFDLSGHHVIGEYLNGDAAGWFTVAGYDPGFLVEVALAQTAISGDNPYLPWAHGGFYDRNGHWLTWDSRALVAAQIAAAGRDTSLNLVSRLSEEGLLDAFLHPESAFGDEGTGVGAVLAQLGTGMDPTTAELVAEVMHHVADRGAEGGLAAGAALMVAPHLPSLVSSSQAGDLQQTPLAARLSPEGEVVTGFLAEVLAEEAGQEALFGLGSLHLIQGLDAHFDPADPSSIAAVTAGYGEVMDLLVTVMLDHELADARRRDELNALVGNILSFGIDLAVAGGIALVGPAAVASVIAAEVGGAFITNVGLPSLTDFGLHTDNAEGVLASGYSVENQLVYGARREIFARLHEAGVVTLPSDWFSDGQAVVVAEADWDAFSPNLVVQLPDGDYYAWLNHANAIGGAIDWQPDR